MKIRRPHAVIALTVLCGLSQAALAGCETNSAYVKIDKLPYTIKAPGKYCLTKSFSLKGADFTSASQDAIRIDLSAMDSEDEVLLDLNQMNITLVDKSGMEGWVQSGVYVDAYYGGAAQIDISNGKIQSFNYGIRFNGNFNVNDDGALSRLTVDDLYISYKYWGTEYNTGGISVDRLDAFSVFDTGVYVPFGERIGTSIDVDQARDVLIKDCDITSLSFGITVSNTDQAVVRNTSIYNIDPPENDPQNGRHDGVSFYKVGLAAVNNLDINGFMVGLRYNSSFGPYSRVAVANVAEECFYGGTPLGNANTCAK